MRRKHKQILFRFLCVFPSLVVAVAAIVLYVVMFSPTARGLEINFVAWEATYRERGLAVPPSGPREGYWEDRLGESLEDYGLGWRHGENALPGLFDVDKDGCQHFRPSAAPDRTLLVIGGSVAWGTYASSIQHAYFHILGERLQERGVSAQVTVCAASAWKSIQDLRALERFGTRLNPDVVIFINGLNDLTNGPRYDTLHGGSHIDKLHELAELFKDPKPQPHYHDYEERVAFYLNNLWKAAEWSAQHDTKVLVVLQPSLFECRQPSKLEKVLLDMSLQRHFSRSALVESYAGMRRGLKRLAEANEHVYFLDCSRIFDSEKATTFTDQWHFSDPGHELLGKRIAEAVLPMLQPVGRELN